MPPTRVGADDGDLKAHRVRPLLCPLVPRLRFEGCDTDKALTDPASEFYGRADAFAMDKYTFYECFSCKVLPAGGTIRCAVSLTVSTRGCRIGSDRTRTSAVRRSAAEPKPRPTLSRKTASAATARRLEAGCGVSSTAAPTSQHSWGSPPQSAVSSCRI